MIDNPIHKTIQEGLKVQAKFIALAILYSLVQADQDPISTEKVKTMADVIYTCLYSFQYCNKSASAEAFLKFHAGELRYEDWEPELVMEVGE